MVKRNSIKTVLLGVLLGFIFSLACGATKPVIQVIPESGLLGQPIDIRAEGFKAGQQITLRARSEDGNEVIWESYATYLADSEGVVDIVNQSPISGTYTDVDPSGLFWSMRPVNIEEKDWKPYNFGDLDRLIVTLEAEVDGQVLSEARVERLIRLPESKLVRESIREEGLVATFFHPAGGGPYPAVINLGGSGGGLSEQREALLSSCGYAVLALAYFGIEPLPQECVEIPLEYFEKAIKWLKSHKAVAPERIAVMGGSKGGELALLLGATFPDIRAVVGLVPSGIIWQGLGQRSFVPRSSWSREGEELPFAPFNWIQEDIQKLMKGEPIAFREWYNPQKIDPERIKLATIPVEKIKGPILLISGSDDLMWPSEIFSEMVIERLKKHDHPFPAQHICYQGAGHFLRLPYLPTVTNQKHRQYIVGGNARDDAHASLGSWTAILDFLDKHLRGN
jgi:acetyl esterase/lipase